MREIKFRYWNSFGKHYHYDQNCVIECLRQQLIGEYNHIADGSFFEQFTGLLDKNGREIYEGDVLAVDYDEIGSPITCGFMGIVEYLEGAFWVSNNTDSEPVFQEIAEWKVIGNIHENQELLK